MQQVHHSQIWKHQILKVKICKLQKGFCLMKVNKSLKQNKGYNIHLLFNPNYCWSHSAGLKLAFICWNLLLSLHKKHPRMSIICRTHKWRPNTNARWMEKIEQTKKAGCHNSCNLSKRNTELIRHIFFVLYAHPSNLN